MQQSTSEQTEKEFEDSNLSIAISDNDSNPNKEDTSDSDLNTKRNETRGQIIQRHKREVKVQEIHLFIILQQ
jgi:hypothetical protein